MKSKLNIFTSLIHIDLMAQQVEDWTINTKVMHLISKGGGDN